LRVRDRRNRLKTWLHLGAGLLDYGGDNYANLLRILVTDPALIVRGLPGTSDNEMSTMAFAQSIYDMVASPTRNPLGAPILPKGAFWPAIQVAVAHIKVLAPIDPPKFIVNVLRITAEHLKIRFVPYKKLHNGPGRQSRTPVWDTWASLGASNPHQEVNALILRPEEAMHRSALDAQMVAMGRDNHVTWAFADVKLRDVANDINRNSLPSDWIIPSQSTGYVLDTYHYVRDSYDNKNDVHKLALLIAIILSHCLPNIHAPKDASKLLQSCNTKSETRKLVRSLPWVAKAKTKGSKESHIHATMFATFIIALYDSRSPLRKYMAEHQNSLGDLWADKHSLFFFSSFFCLPLSLPFSGPKGVISFTLLRVGLTWGLGSKAHSSPRFGHNWGLLPLKDITALLHDLQKKIKTQPHGVGDALVTLLGRQKAEEVALKENVVLRAISTTQKRPLDRHGLVSDPDEPPSFRLRTSDFE